MKDTQEIDFRIRVRVSAPSEIDARTLYTKLEDLLLDSELKDKVEVESTKLHSWSRLKETVG